MGLVVCITEMAYGHPLPAPYQMSRAHPEIHQDGRRLAGLREGVDPFLHFARDAWRR
jgi:hypothetical protein